MDGYISSRNNSCLFAGNRRVTWLLVEAVIATVAEQAKKKKKAPLKEAKTSQIENSITVLPTPLDWEPISEKWGTHRKKRRKKETTTSNEDENAEENMILHNGENR